MKLIIAFCFVIFFLSTVHGQKIFQGSIVYTLHAPQEKTDAELTILFGPNKIKIKFKEKEDYEKTYLLIDFDSSTFYTVNVDSKTFQAKKLVEVGDEAVAAPKTIAGYVTNPLSIKGSGLGGLVGFSGNTVLYTAPDLYFPVPKKYTSIPQLMMISDNHIVLGAEVSLTLPGMATNEMPDSIRAQMKVSAEAKKVSPQLFDVSEFSIPNDFTANTSKNYLMTDTAYVSADSIASDSTAMMIDTTKRVPPVKSEMKTKPAPGTPKKTIPKSEAMKPKNNQTKT
jgi:hypothetical protein